MNGRPSERAIRRERPPCSLHSFPRERPPEEGIPAGRAACPRSPDTLRPFPRERRPEEAVPAGRFRSVLPRSALFARTPPEEWTPAGRAACPRSPDTLRPFPRERRPEEAVPAGRFRSVLPRSALFARTLSGGGDACRARGVSAQPSPPSGCGGAHGVARTRGGLSVGLHSEPAARAPAGTRRWKRSRQPKQGDGRGADSRRDFGWSSCGSRRPRARRHPTRGSVRAQPSEARVRAAYGRNLSVAFNFAGRYSSIT
jgi:hypothetical protein